MIAELNHLPADASRTRFALGCSWAILLDHMRRPLGHDEPGRIARAAMGIAIGASSVLVAYGLESYPGLRTETGTWAAVAVLAATLTAYGLITTVLSRETEDSATVARRYGSLIGLTVGGSWFFLLTSYALTPDLSFLPLAIALLAPPVTAGAVAAKEHSAAAGVRTAVWAGLTGGMLIFIAYSVCILVTRGKPYDAALINEFHHSGTTTSLASYAVGDGLTQALTMMVIVPVVGVAFGSLASSIAASKSDSIPR